LTVLNSFSKQSFLVSTNVTSALEVFFNNDMRYINSRFTYLLTYLQPTVCSSTSRQYPRYQPRGQPPWTRPQFSRYQIPPGRRPGTPDSRFSSQSCRSQSPAYDPRWSGNRPSSGDRPRQEESQGYRNLRFRSGPGQIPRIESPRPRSPTACCWICSRTDCRSFRHTEHPEPGPYDQSRPHPPRGNSNRNMPSGNSSRGPRAGIGPQGGQRYPASI